MSGTFYNMPSIPCKNRTGAFPQGNKQTICNNLNPDEIYNSFYSPIHCNKNYYLNLLKGNNAIALKCNKHNLMLIYQIHGESKLYLFNPSHRVDIMDKPNDQIKKYGHKINLKPGIVIMIPIEWYYFYESNGSSIVGEIESDNYFTVLYNNLR